MSVINQMLKELDQRNVGNNTVRNTEYGNRPPVSFATPEENSHFKKIVAAVVIILILISIYYFKFMYKSINSERQQQVTQQIETTYKEAAQQAIPGAEVVNVQAIEQEVVFVQPVLIDESVIDKSGIDESTVDVIEENVPQLANETPVLNEERPRVVKSNRQLDLKTQADRLYKSARQKLDANQFTDASTLLEQAIAIKPDFHNARILQFSMLFQRQEFDYLRQQVNSSLQLWPKVHQYRLMKARLLVQQNSNDEALALLTTEIPSVISAPEFHAFLAYVAQQTQDDNLAKKHYQLLLQQQSNRADWWLGLAVSEEKLGNKETALQAYENAVEKQGLSMSVLEYARQRIKVLQGF